jgi:transcription initiation factor TFIIF subunit alpha
MSEGGKMKKLKLNPPAATSQGGTPQGSRAGSPTPIGSKGLAASRASSPESQRGKISLDVHVFTAACLSIATNLCMQGKIAFLHRYLLGL